jgi:hypothetical protein
MGGDRLLSTLYPGKFARSVRQKREVVESREIPAQTRVVMAQIRPEQSIQHPPENPATQVFAQKQKR